MDMKPLSRHNNDDIAQPSFFVTGVNLPQNEKRPQTDMGFKEQPLSLDVCLDKYKVIAVIDSARKFTSTDVRNTTFAKFLTSILVLCNRTFPKVNHTFKLKFENLT